jgi:hypothetical protein
MYICFFFAPRMQNIPDPIPKLIFVLIKRLGITWGIHIELVKTILDGALYITRYLVVIKNISRLKKSSNCLASFCHALSLRSAWH